MDLSMQEDLFACAGMGTQLKVEVDKSKREEGERINRRRWAHQPIKNLVFLFKKQNSKSRPTIGVRRGIKKKGGFICRGR